jgi:hypothetical protein
VETMQIPFRLHTGQVPVKLPAFALHRGDGIRHGIDDNGATLTDRGE